MFNNRIICGRQINWVFVLMVSGLGWISLNALCDLERLAILGLSGLVTIGFIGGYRWFWWGLDDSSALQNLINNLPNQKVQINLPTCEIELLLKMLAIIIVLIIYVFFWLFLMSMRLACCILKADN